LNLRFKIQVQPKINYPHHYILQQKQYNVEIIKFLQNIQIFFQT